MLIPEWMLLEEMKQTTHCRMYATIFQVDVPTTHSQLTGSTEGTHRTPSAPRTPNPNTTQGESSALCKPTFIRFRVQSLSDPEKPIPTTAEIDIDYLDEATRLSITIKRSLKDLEAQHNVEKVQEHMVDEEIEQLVEGTENVDEDEFMDDIFNNHEDPSTRLEPRSDKESPKVKKSDDVLIIHDDDEEEESAGDALIRRK
ncbi:hypothetical protein Tco_0417197 [Tanacetum coccineum]